MGSLFYENQFLVSEYIFKLIYHRDGSRRPEICCARDIAKKSLNRLLLLLILKTDTRGVLQKKVLLKIFQISQENIGAVLLC